MWMNKVAEDDEYVDYLNESWERAECFVRGISPDKMVGFEVSEVFTLDRLGQDR